MFEFCKFIGVLSKPQCVGFVSLIDDFIFVFLLHVSSKQIIDFCCSYYNKPTKVGETAFTEQFQFLSKDIFPTILVEENKKLLNIYFATFRILSASAACYLWCFGDMLSPATRR